MVSFQNFRLDFVDEVNAEIFRLHQLNLIKYNVHHFGVLLEYISKMLL